MENKLLSQLSTKEFTTTIYEKLLYCYQLLNYKSNKRKIKQYQPKLTSEEKFLFDNVDILSAYQNIIANSCQQHRYQQTTIINRLPIHQFCRKGIYPQTSIQRPQIDDNQVPWTVDLLDYNPPYYTHSSLINATDEIDPELISSNFMWNTFDTNYNVDRRTANPIGYYSINTKGYPLNPLGRTGLCGRGELKRWAVNYQTHLVIMCGTNEIQSGKEIFKYIMSKSKDNYYYRLPSTWTTGTNMNAITKTLQTYLFNIYQSWNNLNEIMLISKIKINEILKHLTFVSTAYIDDSKNTDNAWLETSVCCYIQTNIQKDISSNLNIDLNELFPEPSNTTYTWHHVSRTTQLLDSEHDVIKLIAKRYNAFW